MKYVLYLRISTKKQDLRTQEKKCLDYLNNLHSSRFDYEVYYDKISSRKPLAKRQGLQDALSALKKGDTLVGMRVDRLARNLYETTCIIHELEKKKAEIILIDQPGIKNKVLLGLYAGIAEEEVKMIRKRITETLSVKKSRNERVSRHLPYGYELDQNQLVSVKDQNGGRVLKQGVLVPKADEQVVLALMNQYFAEGNTYRTIAKRLNELGYRNREGNPFQHMSIYRILGRTMQATSSDQLQEETEAVRLLG